MNTFYTRMNRIASTLFVLLTVGALELLLTAELAIAQESDEDKAMNAEPDDGSVGSKGFTLGAFDPAKSYALLVGVNEYDDPKIEKLTFASKDARDLRDALMKLGIPKGNIELCASGEGGPTNKPTKENVLNKLNRIISELKKGEKTNAMIFVSFSGHGFETSGEVKKAAFGTCDVAFDSSRNIKVDTAILLDDVAKKLQTELPDVAFKVFVVDACRTVVDDATPKSLDAQNAKPKSIRLNLNDTTGIAYLQSCSSGQSSYELENLKQGVFTHYLLEALKKENVNGVSFTSVLGHVVTETHRHMEGKQIPAYAVNISDFWIRKPIDVDAICRRGREMLFGIGTPVDWKQAEERLDDAKKKGNAGAAALLTWMKIQSDEKVSAEEDEKVSAEELYAVTFNSKAQNDPWGQWLFGYCCANGIIVPRDDDKADKYFKEARDLFGGEKWKKGRWQDPAVKFVDALCYMNGWGVDKNSKTARKKLEEIQSSVVAARRELALFYIKGRGGVKKVDEGIQMLKRASGSGDAFAAAYLAGVYLETEINYAEADRYIKRGEEKKVAKASYYYGKRLEKGLGVAVNKKSAFEKYKLAATRHCVEAQVRVAQCYLKGELGENKDEKLALEWFKRAADQNSPEALRALASSELKALMSEEEIKRYDERRKEVNAAIFR